LAGDEPLNISEFIDFFREVSLPYQFSDSMFAKKEKDSLLVSYKVFTQFIPDTLLNNVFGKGVKPKIYSLAKVTDPVAETYLFVKATTNDKKALFILSFDKEMKYVSGMTGLRLDQSAATTQSVTFDKNYTITKTVIQKRTDGSIGEGKDVYVLNAASKSFMLIMTDALDDKITELINPIDTLPAKNKLAGDYGSGKMNLVSVRDGRKNDRIAFFVHFEKNNGECQGELKGEAILKSATSAEYKEDGDPCLLKFNFTANSVTLSEENCGSRRGLNCSFNGSFPKKKITKPSTTSKPVKKK
jgi:hypothetical protein